MSTLTRIEELDFKERTLKEDLKLIIIARRQARGQHQIKVEFKDPQKMELTQEEILKKERRREQNRRAAQRCRTKKRLNQSNAIHSFEKMSQVNKVLFQELEKVARERDDYKTRAENQIVMCPCGNVFSTKDGVERRRSLRSGNGLMGSPSQIPVKENIFFPMEEQSDNLSIKRSCVMLHSSQERFIWGGNALENSTPNDVYDCKLLPCLTPGLDQVCTSHSPVHFALQCTPSMQGPPQTSPSPGFHHVGSTPPFTSSIRHRAPSVSASDTASMSDSCDARHSSISSEDFPVHSVSSHGSLHSDSMLSLIQEHRAVDLPDLDNDDVFHATHLDVNNNAHHVANNNHYLLSADADAAPSLSDMATDEDVGAVFTNGLLSLDVRDQIIPSDDLATLDDVTSLLAISQDELVQFSDDSELLQVYS
ncbi:stress response protein NST1 [Biomphalaria glabrata]|uniref:Uncharacterized protein LOC106054249 n=1 Tax=Biomphalaria glabrata TaxID=6526 RepID=A0A9U8DXK7_BIOGL|nr:uncharacterized protein LOC106054249 [Biomphalaria glabrata]